MNALADSAALAVAGEAATAAAAIERQLRGTVTASLERELVNQLVEAP